MKELTGVMKALSDPNRVKILKMLQGGPLCVCQIHGALDLAQPTVSRHLKVLETAGFIASRRERNWVHYRLAGPEESGRLGPEAAGFARRMLELLAGWLEDDPEVIEARRRVSGGCKVPLLEEDGRLAIPSYDDMTEEETER